MLNKENAKMRIKYFGKSFVSFFLGWEWKEATRQVKYVLQKLGKGYVTIRLEDN